MLSKNVLLSIPVKPYIALYLQVHYPSGIVMGQKSHYGNILRAMATSYAKNKTRPVDESVYSVQFPITCSRNLVWEYGKRAFIGPNIAQFNDLVNDDMEKELLMRINTAQAYSPAEAKDVILMFMEDYQISELTTFEKWRRGISRIQERNSKNCTSVQRNAQLSEGAKCNH